MDLVEASDYDRERQVRTYAAWVVEHASWTRHALAEHYRRSLLTTARQLRTQDVQYIERVADLIDGELWTGYP